MDDALTGVRSILATTPARWTLLATTVPDDLLRREPTPGEWAAIDCLRHLRDAERDAFQVRLEEFRAGQDLVPFDSGRIGSASHGETAPALAEDFARRRAASLERLSDLRPEELEITVTHGEYGPVQLGAMLHYWAAHDLMHTMQAECALMQPFITRSGPWRVMCADYDVEDVT
jgi:hypothetical protein